MQVTNIQKERYSPSKPVMSLRLKVSIELVVEETGKPEKSDSCDGVQLSKLIVCFVFFPPPQGRCNFFFYAINIKT